MQVSSELCVLNWFKCAGNILSVDSVCIFTGFSPVFVQLEKGVGANLKQVYKSTSRLLLHVELVEWSKEYSKCEFYLCICMVSFVGMHHLDRSMLYTHTHTHPQRLYCIVGLAFQTYRYVNPKQSRMRAQFVGAYIYIYLQIQKFMCVQKFIYIYIQLDIHILNTHIYIYIYIKFRADRILLNGLQHV